MEQLGEIAVKLQSVERLLEEVRDALRSLSNQQKGRPRKFQEPIGNYLLRLVKEYAINGEVSGERMRQMVARVLVERNLHEGLFWFWMENLARAGMLRIEKTPEPKVTLNEEDRTPEGERVYV